MGYSNAFERCAIFHGVLFCMMRLHCFYQMLFAWVADKDKLAREHRCQYSVSVLYFGKDQVCEQVNIIQCISSV